MHHPYFRADELFAGPDTAFTSVMLSAAKHPGIVVHCLTLQMRGFFAQFILSGQSEILRCAQDDSEGLRMTGGGVFLYE
jgi:hypothetical protein